MVGDRVTFAFGNKWRYCGGCSESKSETIIWDGCMVSELARELRVEAGHGSLWFGYGEGEATSYTALVIVSVEDLRIE